MTLEDNENWHDKAQNKFASGDWIRLPAEIMPATIMLNNTAYAHILERDIQLKHIPWYAHRSVDIPGNIAFFDGEAKGEQWRITTMKPGRFLAKFYPYMNSDRIQAAVIAFLAHNQPLMFASTPDEIVDVYTNSGISSCMSHSGDDFDSTVHPTYVYGAGDLQIAYIPQGARVLCWPEKKVYGRVYAKSDELRDRITQELSDLGYRHRPYGLSGARLLRIPHENKDSVFVVPYLDGGLSVSDRGDYLIIDDDGTLADNTNGILDLQYKTTCEVCNEGFIPDGEESVCRLCDENSSYCEHCDDTMYGNPIMHRVETASGDEMWCEYCYDAYAVTCDRCNDNISAADCDKRDGDNYCKMCYDRLFSDDDEDVDRLTPDIITPLSPNTSFAPADYPLFQWLNIQMVRQLEGTEA